MQYPLADIYKHNGRECKIFGLRPYRNNCRCSQCCGTRDTGFSADIKFLDNGEVKYKVDSEELNHQSGDPRNWPEMIRTQGFDSVYEYHEILRIGIPKTVKKEDYVNNILPKVIYLQRLSEV